MNATPGQLLGTFSTATISDALDKLGRPGSLLGLSALFNGAKLCGPAFTVRYVPAGSPPGTVGDYLDDVAAGQIVVLDNAGRTDCTVWGDILTAMAHDRAIGGTVIDGVCRDTSRALEEQYPIYSRGRFMRTGKDRVEVAEVGGTVSIGGVQVRAGDTMVGDTDGVVVVAREIEEEVLRIAQDISSRESEILAAVLAGSTIAEARQRYGYHQLQRGAGGRL